MLTLLLLGLGQEPGLFEDTEWRRDLRDRGITATRAWTGEVIANVDGGLDEDVASAMLLDLIVEADFETLLGWTGGSALFNPLWIEGGGLTERDLGDLSVASNIDAPAGPRVYELWVEQGASDDFISLRAGLLAFDAEGAVTPQGLVFVNSAFGAPPYMTLNVPAPVYPIGFLGARLRVQPTPELYAFAAVYEGDAGAPPANRHGLTFRRPAKGEGLLAVAEAGHETDALTVRAGAFLHTGEHDDYRSGGTDRGCYGLYALADARLPSFPALGAFVRAGVARENLAVAAFTLDVGITWKGACPGRGDDVLGLGLAWIELADDFRRAQADPDAYDREIVIELTYRIAVTPWLSVQPDAQYVRHPGGTSEVDDALVLALRADLQF